VFLKLFETFETNFTIVDKKTQKSLYNKVKVLLGILALKKFKLTDNTIYNG